MATKNAINSNLPIEVAVGGTENSSLTNHSPLIGSATAAISDVVVGTTGTLFLGATVDPFFDDSSDGNFSFTSSTSAQARVITVANTDNTSSSSLSRLDISVGGASAGDPTIKTSVVANNSWMIGVDNSDSDKFKISNNDTDIETNPYLISTVDGEVIKPLQPAFGAVASDQSNVTGDGTVYRVTFTSDEYFDQNGDFDGTSIFTAPVTGKYQFNSSITLNNIGSQNTIQMRLLTSNRIYFSNTIDPSLTKNSSNQYTIDSSFFVDMDASDTAEAAVWSAGSTKTMGILGASTFFNGMLVC